MFDFSYLGYFVIICAVVLIFRDVVYRMFFIYPQTSLSGRFSAYMEETDIFRWVSPVLSKKLSHDVYFLGNSHVMDAVDPRIIEQNTGLRAFNMALYGMKMPIMLHLVVEHKHWPRFMFIDISTRYSMFSPVIFKNSLNIINKQARLKLRLKSYIYELIDRIHCLFPSLFIPKPYNNMIFRSLAKIKKYYCHGILDISRYTPFRRVSSYNYSLEKKTNHRIVKKRKKKKTKWEIISEGTFQQKIIEETSSYCPLDSSTYFDSMKIVNSDIKQLKTNGVSVVFMRLPLNREIIQYEDMHYARYFDDIKKIAKENNCLYLDLNDSQCFSNLDELEFYSDGTHIMHPGDVVVSNYLSEILRDLS